MTELEKQRRPKHKAKAPPPGPLPRAGKADLVATGEYHQHDIAVRLGDAWVSWRVSAKELSWEQQLAITDRHTRVTKVGRQESTKVDTTAVMRELLLAMLDGPKCDPPLTADEIRGLKGPVLRAFTSHFGLDEDAAEEEEEVAGESVAP